MTAREAESTPSLTADLLFTDGLPALDDVTVDGKHVRRGYVVTKSIILGDSSTTTPPRHTRSCQLSFSTRM